MEFDRMETLKQIKKELGFIEREEDEYTVKEIIGCFGTSNNIIAFFEKNEIEYTRRKAMANGRRQFVYRFNVIIENTEKEQ